MSVELLDSMGSDLFIVNAARVSFAKESEWETETFEDDSGYEIEYKRRQFLSEKDQKLLSYLANHGHWSPFAHAFLTFRIKVPMFVAMQIDKHTVGLVTNSVSRRYVDDEPEFWCPSTSDGWRGAPVNVKQGSTGYFKYPDVALANFMDSYNIALEQYDWAIKNGMAPEQARICLPMGTMTERIWSGSLYAFARVCNLRLDQHAQAETREVAQKVDNLVPKQFQHSWKALVKHG